MRTAAGHPLNLSRRSLLAGLGVAALTLTSCGPSASADDALRFHAWGSYTGAALLADFQRNTGIAVAASSYTSTAALLADLHDNPTGYDVIVPSSEMVTQLRRAHMLHPLNKEKLPNFRNIAAEFADPVYDRPAPRHAAPISWLVVGIGYRRSRVHGVPDSWRWLYESDLYKGRIALSGEAADLIRLGARYLGHSLNAVTPDVTRQVEEMLIRQKANVRAFADGTGHAMLAAGQVDLAMAVNGDIARIARTDPDIGFVVPHEGSLLSADALCIPAGARHVEQAHRFIDYLLGAEAGRDLAEQTLFPTTNAAARALMPPAWRDDPIVFPHGPGMEASEWGQYEGPEQARAFAEALARVHAA